MTWSRGRVARTEPAAPVQEALRIPWGGIGPARSIEGVFRSYDDFVSGEVISTWRSGKERRHNSIEEMHGLSEWPLLGGMRVVVTVRHGPNGVYEDWAESSRLRTRCHIEGEAEDRVLGRKVLLRGGVAAATRARRFAWRVVLAVAAVASILSVVR